MPLLFGYSTNWGTKGVASLDRFGIQLKSSDQNLAAALGGLKTGFHR